MAATVAGLTLGAASTAANAAIGSYTTRGAWSFVSAPRLHPPKLPTRVRASHPRLASGDFLLDNFPATSLSGPMIGEGGPLIVDNKLRPVWFHPVGKNVVSGDLQQETYGGKPVLVWWQGDLNGTGASTSGEILVVDQDYRRIATLRARAPWIISLHDATISGAAIWVTVYRYVRGQNLTPYGGPRKGTVYDAGVQEYDLKTGQLLFTWDALNPGHAPNVPLSSSKQPASAASATGGVWDAYHVNSIQVLPGNELLVSMRNTWAAYLIDLTTGKIVWQLGGKGSTFSFGPGASFQWQHDVQLVSGNQLLPGSEITLFDDNCCGLLSSGGYARPNGGSQGMILRIDPVTRTASLVAAYGHRPNRYSGFLGSMQVLPNGNVLVGWGDQPYFSEYSRSGRLLLDAFWPGKDQSYRALFTSSWVGTPYYPPAATARKKGAKTTVYASWNGATTVTRWQVLGGPTTRHLHVIATRSKAGFETAIGLKLGGYRVFQVRALNAHGVVIGRSRTFR